MLYVYVLPKKMILISYFQILLPIIGIWFRSMSILKLKNKPINPSKANLHVVSCFIGHKQQNHQSAYVFWEDILYFHQSQVCCFPLLPVLTWEWDEFCHLTLCKISVFSKEERTEEKRESLSPCSNLSESFHELHSFVNERGIDEIIVIHISKSWSISPSVRVSAQHVLGRINPRLQPLTWKKALAALLSIDGLITSSTSE